MPPVPAAGILQKDEQAPLTDTLGMGITATGFGAWSNGLTVMNEDGNNVCSVDKYGIVGYLTKAILPARHAVWCGAEKGWNKQNEKKFIYTNPIEGFGLLNGASWCGYAYKDSIAAILFLTSNLAFRDIIMSKALLNLFGPPGAGGWAKCTSQPDVFRHSQTHNAWRRHHGCWSARWHSIKKMPL